MKRELKTDQVKAKAENEHIVEEYNLAKEKMKDPMYFKQLKISTVKEIYGDLYCRNNRVKSMTGKDPVVQSLESIMQLSM